MTTDESPPEPVTLTPEEQALLAQVSFDARKLNYETARANGAAVAALLASLLERDTIPQIRLRYLYDPKLNVGGHNSSRLDVFRKNGRSLDETVEHPHFLPYFRYLLFGPDLPEGTVAGFRQILDDDLGTEGGLREQLRTFARAEVRRRFLDRLHAMEEFFKLALECDLDLSAAWSIRDAVRDTR